jgi:site-specific DNA-adenine methylase
VGTYVEPFFGGGAVFLHIEPKKSIIADLNARLFGFYMYVKNKPDELHKGIFDISKETREAFKKHFGWKRWSQKKFNSLVTEAIRKAVEKEENL